MASNPKSEYQAKVSSDTGIVRAKVPSPLVRLMGGRPGDYLVFKMDGANRVTMTLSRSRGGAKKPGAHAKGTAKGIMRRR